MSQRVSRFAMVMHVLSVVSDGNSRKINLREVEVSHHEEESCACDEDVIVVLGTW